MKSLTQFLEAQNFLIKGHTKKQKRSLMYYSQQFLDKKIVEPEKYIEPLRIYGENLFLHIGVDKISDDDNYINEKECEKRIQQQLKSNYEVYLEFRIKNYDRFKEISKIVKSVFKKADCLINQSIYIQFTNLDVLKNDLDNFLSKIN